MRTILVVDDDPWVRILARDMLADEGYRVLEASDGQDAIRVAAQHPGPIHLLLTDVVMPGLNGCELASGLTALLPGIKVMFMSAYDRDFLVARGLVPPGRSSRSRSRWSTCRGACAWSSLTGPLPRPRRSPGARARPTRASSSRRVDD